jgi:hypothetical protein
MTKFFKKKILLNSSYIYKGEFQFLPSNLSFVTLIIPFNNFSSKLSQLMKVLPFFTPSYRFRAFWNVGPSSQFHCGVPCMWCNVLEALYQELVSPRWQIWYIPYTLLFQSKNIEIHRKLILPSNGAYNLTYTKVLTATTCTSFNTCVKS